MDEKLKALSQDEQHTFTKALMKLACFARKFDGAVLKRPTAYIKGRAADTEHRGTDQAADARGAQAEPETLQPRLRPQLKLGILRLDYNYEPAPGDIDYPMSFKYKVTSVYTCLQSKLRNRVIDMICTPV